MCILLFMSSKSNKTNGGLFYSYSSVCKSRKACEFLFCEVDFIFIITVLSLLHTVNTLNLAVLYHVFLNMALGIYDFKPQDRYL